MKEQLIEEGVVPNNTNKTNYGKWFYSSIVVVGVFCIIGFSMWSWNTGFFNTKKVITITDPTKVPANIKEVCDAVSDNEKFDCYPEPTSNEANCLKRGCCWKPPTFKRPANLSQTHWVPYCFYPPNYDGYHLESAQPTPYGLNLALTRSRPSGFPKDLEKLLIECTFLNDNQLRIKVYDPHRKRYEIPFPKIKVDTNYQTESSAYNVGYDTQRVWITRISSGKMIFSLKYSEMIFADQMIQASIRLPSKYIYGVGETKTSFLRNTMWSNSILFARDRAPTENTNLYSSHPFYLSMEDEEGNSGDSHGVVLLNSNPMEVIFTPSPAITFRPIGGILEFMINMGPSPNEVIRQYTSSIGTSFMPPFWSLGFHLCRWGYNNTANTRAVWQRTRDAEIPYDVQWNDIDWMHLRDDFSLDENFKDLPQFVDDLHNVGMHYVMILDPGISNTEEAGKYPPYDDGVKMDIFIKNASGQILIGKTWNPVSTVFPDFTNPKALEYWSKQLKLYHDQVSFDGTWLDMNEPSNFYDGSMYGCPENSSLENPPFIPGNIEPLKTKTICMTAKQFISEHYNIHNMYGSTEAIVTNTALANMRKKRPFIIIRSSFLGLGHYAGVWDGDIYSSWDHMQWTVSSILNLNMFGISMSGGDICGFNGNSNEELCARWSELGAFYPFSRNHNTIEAIEQDPVALGPVVTKAAKKALETRYFLLPYLYTLFSRSHIYGETVARPLFFEFPDDKITFTMDRQFLLGPALMVAPVLESGKTMVEVYLPSGMWYELKQGASHPGGTVVLPAPIDEINILIRGGYILPARKHATTTTETRKNNYTLLVALDVDSKGTGELYWDDGDSLETYEQGRYTLVKFEATKGLLNTICTKQGYMDEKMDVEKVVIYGVDKIPDEVQLNESPIATYEYNANYKVLTVHISASLFDPNSLSWK